MSVTTGHQNGLVDYRESFRDVLPLTTVRPAIFFIAVYLLSWLIWIPLVLSHYEIGSFHIPEDTSTVVRLLGVLMPSVSALGLTAISGGFKSVRSLLQPIKTWRVGWRWWGAAAIVQPALLVISAMVYNYFWSNPEVTTETGVSSSAFVINVFFLIVATLGEEIGWRGLALPALERKYGAFWASFILGLLWATWHVPFWLLLDTFTQFGFIYLVLNYLFILAGTFYITWFYNHGRFSLLLPIVFHITFNIVNVAWFPVTTSIGAFVIMIALDWIIAIAIIRQLEPGQYKVK